MKVSLSTMKDIIRIDYGKGSAFTALTHNPPLDKWRCFSITHKQSGTDYSTVNFVAASDFSVAK